MSKENKMFKTDIDPQMKPIKTGEIHSAALAFASRLARRIYGNKARATGVGSNGADFEENRVSLFQATIGNSDMSRCQQVYFHVIREEMGA